MRIDDIESEYLDVLLDKYGRMGEAASTGRMILLMR